MKDRSTTKAGSSKELPAFVLSGKRQTFTEPATAPIQALLLPSRTKSAEAQTITTAKLHTPREPPSA
ncbi:hypothetical protein NSND_63185 [Nitrospira sp. ND1]|nr:hypothetical protein NSND_63185 [Nitrospira sp. ND1]